MNLHVRFEHNCGALLILIIVFLCCFEKKVMPLDFRRAYSGCVVFIYKYAAEPPQRVAFTAVKKIAMAAS